MKGGIPRIEPGTSRTLSENNHTTRPMPTLVEVNCYNIVKHFLNGICATFVKFTIVILKMNNAWFVIASSTTHLIYIYVRW
ncbi:hypothetical protein GLYMA_11G246800v4 [Glycine max]|uniref:Uncharacterized protein n=1 Tax=Glycine max TaxID=3847 RepID=A0A0R0HLS3_SOYBN|nr:hypothetical protein GYH30_032128 [Glycine max]KRH31414.1 hypothetical protein GLYMA_11G246800v4 [Glycine max]